MTAPLEAPIFAPKVTSAHLLDGHLSIVVFGPGEGEAIVVRLPNGDVGVVDGCCDRDDPVLELVRSLNVGRLSFVCMTHPHDDHFKGLDAILKEYSDRIDSIWENGAVTARNYESWVEWMRLRQGRRKPIGDEKMARLRKELDEPLTRIYLEMGNAMERYPNSYSALRTRMQLVAPRLVENVVFEVCAWGPREYDFLQASQKLLEWFRNRKKGDDNVPVFDPNAASGALLLRWGDSRILLAGDLLNESWSMIAPDAAEVQVVNVAHHASHKAHHDLLWEKMRPSLAIVTPFMHASGSQPPRPEDVQRLASSCRVAVTSPPKWLELNRPDWPRPTAAIQTPKVGLKSASSTPAVVASGSDDRYNAVAVSMDAKGRIVQVVLAGRARFYR